MATTKWFPRLAYPSTPPHLVNNLECDLCGESWDLFSKATKPRFASCYESMLNSMSCDPLVLQVAESIAERELRESSSSTPDNTGCTNLTRLTELVRRLVELCSINHCLEGPMAELLLEAPCKWTGASGHLSRNCECLFSSKNIGSTIQFLNGCSMFDDWFRWTCSKSHFELMRLCEEQITRIPPRRTG